MTRIKLLALPILTVVLGASAAGQQDSVRALNPSEELQLQLAKNKQVRPVRSEETKQLVFIGDRPDTVYRPWVAPSAVQTNPYAAPLIASQPSSGPASTFLTPDRSGNSGYSSSMYNPSDTFGAAIFSLVDSFSRPRQQAVPAIPLGSRLSSVKLGRHIRSLEAELRRLETEIERTSRAGSF